MALDCKFCNFPLDGIRLADREETGIQRAALEDLCNVCAAMHQAIAEQAYWTKLQNKYLDDMGYWEKEK